MSGLYDPILENAKILMIGDQGEGKCLGKDTPVILHSGEIIPVQNVKPGDLLMGPDSAPRRVLSTSTGHGKLFRIVPVRGDPWVCNDIHVMTLKGRGRKKGQIIDLPLNDYLKRVPLNCTHVNNQFCNEWKLFTVPVEWPIPSFGRSDLFDPYIMGLWLGDGRFDRPEIHCPDQEVISYLLNTNFDDLTPRHFSPQERCDYVAITGGEGRGRTANWFTQLIETFTLNGEKRIRRDYLIASRHDRMELLAGLIDTDGYHNNGAYEIITQYPGLAEDIKFLGRSLGFNVNQSAKTVLYNDEYREYPRLSIVGNCAEIPVKIMRKKAKDRIINKDPCVTAFSVQDWGEGEFYGFTLDGDGRFLLGDFTVTHNTGAKAALVAMGYKLRMIDTDNGFKILRGLLTSDHYPYKRWMEKTGVKPEENISFKQIEVPMGFKTWEEKDKGGRVLFTRDVLAPTSSNAWAEVVKLLKGDWKENGENFGPIHEWDNNTILDFDTMSTLAEIAKYWVQDLNGHLGALTDEHGRDTGGAQEMIMRMLNLVLNANVRANVIITGHIKRIDMTGDIPQSPEARLRAQKSVEAKGFPAVIGQAVGPYIGKKFNDQFVVKRESEGRGAERRIYTVPVANTNTKNSVWLEDSYPLSTGLAEIFAALRYQPHPTEFVEFVRGKTKPSGEAAMPAPGKFGGFGR